MVETGHHIYLEKIPFVEDGEFWVSFESHPKLKKTKDNIYGRCLPCIQGLYYQLKAGKKEIALGNAYNCWKVTAVVKSLEDVLNVLSEFERRHSVGHVYGKFGSSKPGVMTKVVVFHTEDVRQRDLIKETLEECARCERNIIDIQISRGCAQLYEDLFGDWRNWREITEIKYPENIERILHRIEKVLYWVE